MKIPERKAIHGSPNHNLKSEILTKIVQNLLVKNPITLGAMEIVLTRNHIKKMNSKENHQEIIGEKRKIIIGERRKVTGGRKNRPKTGVTIRNQRIIGETTKNKKVGTNTMIVQMTIRNMMKRNLEVVEGTTSAIGIIVLKKAGAMITIVDLIKETIAKILPKNHGVNRLNLKIIEMIGKMINQTNPTKPVEVLAPKKTIPPQKEKFQKLPNPYPN